MKGTLILADSAQADPNGRIHALGAGWTVTSTPTPPIGLLVFVDCPWDQTNVKHRLLIELLDTDGRVVSFKTDDRGSPEPAVRVETDFEVGRPLGVPKGSPIRQVLAINITGGLPLTAREKYEFHLSIDDEHVDSWLATFSVRAA
jgi:hypothetical protein